MHRPVGPVSWNTLRVMRELVDTQDRGRLDPWYQLPFMVNSYAIYVSENKTQQYMYLKIQHGS